MSMFGKPSLSLRNTKDRKEVARNIDSGLGPANFTCDGELSRSQVQAKSKRLTTVAQQLKELDSSVTFYEL